MLQKNKNIPDTVLNTTLFSKMNSFGFQHDCWYVYVSNVDKPGIAKRSVHKGIA